MAQTTNEEIITYIKWLPTGNVHSFMRNTSRSKNGKKEERNNCEKEENKREKKIHYQP